MPTRYRATNGSYRLKNLSFFTTCPLTPILRLLDSYIQPPAGGITCATGRCGGERSHRDDTRYEYSGNALTHWYKDHYYATTFQNHVSEGYCQ